MRCLRNLCCNSFAQLTPVGSSAGQLTDAGSCFGAAGRAFRQLKQLKQLFSNFLSAAVHQVQRCGLSICVHLPSSNSCLQSVKAVYKSRDDCSNWLLTNMSPPSPSVKTSGNASPHPILIPDLFIPLLEN